MLAGKHGIHLSYKLAQKTISPSRRLLRRPTRSDRVPQDYCTLVHFRRHRLAGIGTAPNGSEHTRRTDRTYTHAILLEGEEGWGAVGFCGRPDLAEKKRGEHPGSIVVECGVLGDRAADVPEAEATEPTATPADEEKTVD